MLPKRGSISLLEIDWQVRLEDADIESVKQLDEIIKKLETELRKAKLRETGEEETVVCCICFHLLWMNQARLILHLGGADVPVARSS